VVRRGHLFIAQPPLFKVAKGKKENYVRDEEALDSYLLESSADGTQLQIGERKTYTGLDLRQLSKHVLSFKEHLLHIHKRKDSRVLEAFLSGHWPKEHVFSPEHAQQTVEHVQSYMALYYPEAAPVSVHTEQDTVTPSLIRYRVTATQQGTQKDSLFDRAFFDTAEYRETEKHGSYAMLESHETCVLTFADGSTQSYTRVRDAVEALLEHAKKGLTIQRYKGLGEMNPEQLWETTMNPSNRTLLAVKVEDAVAADSIFTVLMGDQVEPRRDFIEKYALDVRHLDI
jgi:DNA gyrase subunit B